MPKRNNAIRTAAKSKGVYLWEVAERYGVGDTYFSKLLRRELPPEEQRVILGIIDELASREEEA